MASKTLVTQLNSTQRLMIFLLEAQVTLYHQYFDRVIQNLIFTALHAMHADAVLR